MSRIFISYRREDSDIWVGRLADELRKHFPPEQVFQDIASIDPGADFRTVLDEALKAAAAMLVVIGPRWLSATDKYGRKRLESPADLVHQEVAESLRRSGVRVFPLLVNGAEMPAEEDLPEPLKALARRHAFDLTVKHWANDVSQLVQTLKRVPGLAEMPPAVGEAVRQRADEVAKRREGEGGAAKEDVRRLLAEQQARERLDDEASRRHEVADEELRRKATGAARDGVATQRLHAARESGATEQPRTEGAKRSESAGGIGAATVKTSTGAAGGETRRFSWKPLAAVGAIVGALVLLVFFGRSEHPEPTPAPSAPFAPVAGAPTGVPKAETPAAAKGTSPGDTFRDCDQCPEMVTVPAGSFRMGSAASEAGRSQDEGPQHEVRIAKPFAVGRFEVTFDEWDACVAAGGCNYLPGDSVLDRGKRPVINVSWDDAQAYVAWLSKKTGQSYRLLSEAEWEYAARAGTTTRYPWGNEPGSNRANFTLSRSQWDSKQTAPVGSFEPNAFGLHDMIGNVWEWVQDCWNESYGGAPADGSAWGAGDCGRRVLRGGSWDDFPEAARSANRSRVEPGNRYYRFGFRVARTL